MARQQKPPFGFDPPIGIGSRIFDECSKCEARGVVILAVANAQMTQPARWKICGDCGGTGLVKPRPPAA